MRAESKYSSVETGNIIRTLLYSARVMLMLRVHQCFSIKVEYLFFTK